MLTVPDVRQSTEYSCGAACLASVLGYHGLVMPSWAHRLANPDRGMSPDVIEAVLHSASGFPPLRGRMQLADLQHRTYRGSPCICAVTFDAGHWVVVSGVRYRTVYYHDPEHGPCKLPAAKWLASWHDGPSPYRHFGVSISR